MAVATKPTANTNADRLIALYRRELEYRIPHELLEALLELPNMKDDTAARFGARLARPRCSSAAISKMTESAIVEMVHRGHAEEVEEWLKIEADDRADSERRHTLSRLVAGLVQLAQRPDAVAALEAVELVVGRLAAKAGAA